MEGPPALQKRRVDWKPTMSESKAQADIQELLVGFPLNPTSSLPKVHSHRHLTQDSLNRHFFNEITQKVSS